MGSLNSVLSKMCLTRQIVLAAVAISCFALTANAQVTFWNGNPAGPSLDFTGGDAKDLKPIKIVGARNGTFSGKVVVSSSGALAGVSGKITDLQTADGKGKIAATEVQVRLATGDIKSSWQVQPKAASAFDVLNNELAGAVAPITKVDKGYSWVPTGRSYLPVWVTVHVPADAAEGDYTGTLTVTAGGTTKAVPVAMKVYGYTFTPPADFKTWIETIQSPDTLAVEYNVPLWSKAHWDLIEQSLRYGAMVGNKTVYFPLICNTNFGNAESMVRWIKDGKDSAGHDKYKYDFSIVEKYLDLQIKIQGKPQVVCFPLWDTFLEGGMFDGDIKYESAETQAERKAYKGKGPEVTLLDEATGKTDKLQLQPYSDPTAQALWTPLLQQLPDLLKKHGLDNKVLCVGMVTDVAPVKGTVEFIKKALPSAQWVIHAHSFYGGKDKLAEYHYAVFVWGAAGFCTGAEGWKATKPLVLVEFLRNSEDNWPLTMYRMAGEANITGGKRGVGRLGLDYWKVLKNKRGDREAQVWLRYPKSDWRNLNITDTLLAAGKTGPLATARFEMLREGVQECEARIFIQEALDAKKLPAPLADKCKKVLADRLEFLKTTATPPDKANKPSWFPVSDLPEPVYLQYVTGWQDQSDALYQAAGEVAKQVGK